MHIAYIQATSTQMCTKLLVINAQKYVHISVGLTLYKCAYRNCTNSFSVRIGEDHVRLHPDAHPRSRHLRSSGPSEVSVVEERPFGRKTPCPSF